MGRMKDYLLTKEYEDEFGKDWAKKSNNQKKSKLEKEDNGGEE